MKSRNPPFIAMLLLAVLGASTSRALEPAAATRHLGIDELFRLNAVSDPQISPEGDWIAYVITRQDLEKDESLSRVWIVPAGGGEPIAMTAGDVSSSNPRWSPDGRYLAFLSARDEGETQVWRLFRKGGEAEQLTATAQSVEEFSWSPDSRRMLLVLQDPTEQEREKKELGESYREKTAPPWVIDRLQFKDDYVCYLERRRTHIHVLDIASGALS